MNRDTMIKHATVLHQDLTERLGAYLGSIPCASELRTQIAEMAIVNLLADLAIETNPVVLVDETSLPGFGETLGQRFCLMAQNLDDVISDKMTNLTNEFMDAIEQGRTQPAPPPAAAIDNAKRARKKRQEALH